MRRSAVASSSAWGAVRRTDTQEDRRLVARSLYFRGHSQISRGLASHRASSAGDRYNFAFTYLARIIFAAVWYPTPSSCPRFRSAAFSSSLSRIDVGR